MRRRRRRRGRRRRSISHGYCCHRTVLVDFFMTGAVRTEFRSAFSSRSGDLVIWSWVHVAPPCRQLTSSLARRRRGRGEEDGVVNVVRVNTWNNIKIRTFLPEEKEESSSSTAPGILLLLLLLLLLLHLSSAGAIKTGACAF